MDLWGLRKKKGLKWGEPPGLKMWWEGWGLTLTRGKAGGRDFRKTQHFCFLTSCVVSNHLEDKRRDREADGMFFGEKGLLQQS